MRFTAILWLLLVIPGATPACECSEWTGTVEETAASDYAAAGMVGIFEVKRIQPSRRSPSGKRLRGPWVVFVGHRMLKGSSLAGQEHYALLPQITSCAARPRKGEHWVVFAQSEERIELEACSPSGPLVARLDVVSELLQIKKRQATGDAD
jgi:hypothetical protein